MHLHPDVGRKNKTGGLIHKTALSPLKQQDHIHTKNNSHDYHLTPEFRTKNQHISNFPLKIIAYR